MKPVSAGGQEKKEDAGGEAPQRQQVPATTPIFTPTTVPQSKEDQNKMVSNIMDQHMQKFGERVQEKQREKAAQMVSPPNENYVGMWESLTHPIYISIAQNGAFAFDNRSAGQSVSIRGKVIVGWDDNGFHLNQDSSNPMIEKYGAMMGKDLSALSPDWSMERPPHQEDDGEWRMTVRGVEYKRTKTLC